MNSTLGMPDNEGFYQCYNKGCGSKFKLEESGEECCCFHPGAPIFHDAYKGWSCCNKRSTDFTTFLNTKGCSKGKHNPVKPEESVKEKKNSVNKCEVINVSPPKQNQLERPDFDSKLERLKVIITQSLKDELNKAKENKVEILDEEVNGVIKIGESCKNNTCKASFEGKHSNLEICKHHSGIPIFHEGMKYWSCCQRKTSDFETFLQQEGCSSGTHLWLKMNLTKASCRYDWHQTPTHVIVTFYAKLAYPEISHVDVNPIRLKSSIAFGDNQEFNLEEELGGIIMPPECSVTMTATKVEIKMKKAEPKHWPKMFVPKFFLKKDDCKEKNEENLTVDAIDLSDI